MEDDADESLPLAEPLTLEQPASTYSKALVDHAEHPRYMGRMTDPDGAATIKGICGDTMEMYIVVKELAIAEISFFTDGCSVTVAVGSMVTELARGKPLAEALAISPAQVIAELDGVPGGHIHCAILAVSTLFKAIADYLLRHAGG